MIQTASHLLGSYMSDKNADAFSLGGIKKKLETFTSLL